MKYLNLFNEMRNFGEENFNNGDKLECLKSGCLANYGSSKDPQPGETFTLIIRNSIIDKQAEYYLLNEQGQELTYPYRKIEIQMYFKKI